MVPILVLAGSSWQHAPEVGLALLVAAGVSDWLDGYLARSREEVSDFGTLMDPVTDKTLVLGLLFVFAGRGLVPMWAALVVLFRELLVSGVRRVMAARGEVVGANWMGKTKFVLQSLLLVGVFVYLILEREGMAGAGQRRWLAWAAGAVAVVGVVFALNFLRWHADAFRQRGKR